MDPNAEGRFTRIYEHHYADVSAYCARRVNRSEVDDIANEVFVVLWRRIDEVEDETTLAWLYGVTYRTISNRWRSNARWSDLKERIAGFRQPVVRPVDDVVVQRDQDRQVLAALDRLRPADQEILRLSAWEELSAPEIAASVGCSVSAAEQRLHRARKRLAKVLAPVVSPSIAQLPRNSGRVPRLPKEGGRP